MFSGRLFRRWSGVFREQRDRRHRRHVYRRCCRHSRRRPGLPGKYLTKVFILYYLDDK
jgi:hypothetical protein